MSSNNSKQQRKAVDWLSVYSWESLQYATNLANENTKAWGTYITAIKVTEETRTSPEQVIGEWRLTSQYDPRIAAARKAKQVQQ